MESEQRFTSRRTESADAQGVGKLIKRHTEALFGRVDPEYIIEHANLSISLLSVDTNGEVVGHMSLFDSPQSLDHQDDWVTWLQDNYNLTQASPVNSLFLSLFVSKDGFQRGASSEILRTVFMAVPLLQYVFLAVTQGTSIGVALSGHFARVSAVDDRERPFDLYVTHRHAHFPMLSIRRAKVEDTDDLMPVLLQHSTNINQDYGDYFLSELIASQDDQHKTIVAEVDGRAVGLMSVTTLIDVDLLDSAYQLNAYHGLRHPGENDEIVSTGCSDTQSSQSPAGLPDDSTSTPTPHSSTAHIPTPHSSTAHMPTPHSSTAHMPTPHSSTAHMPTPHSSTAHMPTPCASTAHLPTPHSSTAHMPTPHSSTAHLPTPHSSTPHMPTPHSSTAHLPTPHSSTPHMPTPRGSTVLDVQTTTEVSDRSLEVDGQEPSPGKVSGKPHNKQYVLKGVCNALAVQLFAIDERYEMRSIDFLPAVFQLFPDHDFLILTQPHSIGEFPLLANFSCVPPRSGTSIPQELYVMHKCSLLHSFTVSRVTQEDLAGISRLVSDLQGQEDIVGDVTVYLAGKRDRLSEGATSLSAVVAKCSGQVVGVAVLRDEEELEYIRSHYNIEDFVYFSYHRPSEHAHLYHLVLSPAFSSYGKHFIKEVLRLCRKTCLYYHLSPEDTPMKGKPHTVLNTLQHLIPIRPRRQVVYPDGQVLGINAPLSEVTKATAPFALYHTNRKLTFEPKICVNSRVVIVGASETALSLMEALVFCPHLHFTNVTLVSPDGLPRHDSDQPLAELFLNCTHRLGLLGLSTWVNTVKGKVTGLNRTGQYLDVETQGSKFIVHYDWLVFTCGVQYQPPILNGVSPPKHVFSPTGDLPAVVNNIKGPCVVYGCGMDSYCMVNGLLIEGIAPDMITLVQSATPICFDDETIASRISEALSLSGVRVLTGCVLSGWEVCDDSLSAVQLIDSSGLPTTVHCTSMVYMGEKTVDRHAFNALNDACLVFDSRLVISADHFTNDQHILAAGPLTKFSRNYRVDCCSPADYNSEEVGQRLAVTLLSKLDSTFNSTSLNEEDPPIIHPYTQPKVVGGSFPGGLSYLHVSAPPIPGDPGRIREGRELVTDTSNGYFKVHISPSSRVAGLSILSSRVLRERDNYICLYSVHEKYLNNMMSRFDQNLIQDLFTYFREPWACALFYDRFPDFLQEVREYMSLLPAQDGAEGSLEDKVKALVEDDPDSPLTSARPQILSQFNSSPARSLITDRLFRFLEYNKQQLPMYARPDII